MSVKPVQPRIVIRTILSLTIGAMVGVLAHYLVYRLSLPVQPFVYVAF